MLYFEVPRFYPQRRDVICWHGGTVDNFAWLRCSMKSFSTLRTDCVLISSWCCRAETDVEHQVAHWYLDFLMVDEVTSMAISIHHERSTL